MRSLVHLLVPLLVGVVGLFVPSAIGYLKTGSVGWPEDTDYLWGALSLWVASFYSLLLFSREVVGNADQKNRDSLHQVEDRLGEISKRIDEALQAFSGIRCVTREDERQVLHRTLRGIGNYAALLDRFCPDMRYALLESLDRQTAELVSISTSGVPIGGAARADIYRSILKRRHYKSRFVFLERGIFNPASHLSQSFKGLLIDPLSSETFAGQKTLIICCRFGFDEHGGIDLAVDPQARMEKCYRFFAETHGFAFWVYNLAALEEQGLDTADDGLARVMIDDDCDFAFRTPEGGYGQIGRPVWVKASCRGGRREDRVLDEIIGSARSNQVSSKAVRITEAHIMRPESRITST